ncbi:MAG: ribosomal protein S18-alanine N-acetyltransferase [Actinomycetes bacterium]
MNLTITDFSWWQVTKAHKIDQEAFNATAWSLETFWSELSATNRYYIALIDEEKEIVGFAGLAFNGLDADIQTMVIKPEFQNMGYGKKLLDNLLEKVQEKKSNRVFLEVVADNENAIKLYKSRNFEIISKRSNYYPNGKDAVIMQLDLRKK